MIWGTVVSNSDPTRIVQFELQDWGYMFLIYILMMVVRAVLMVGFYPILSKIGLKWNIPEMIFTVAGGLRGAVGIALAISLDNELRRDTVPGDPRREYTTQIYGIAGGKHLAMLSGAHANACTRVSNFSYISQNSWIK